MTATLDNVSKAYGRVVALHPTTLVLERGVVGLLGPNGAGKTTMLRLLSSVLAPDAGTVTVAGHDVTGSHVERTAARRRIGYLPQEVVFPRGMTAFGFLDYIAVLKEWRETARRHDEVRRVLALVDLAERGRTKIKALSGGQRRRLAIAQALLGAPELLILDEPTTGLDPEQRASLRGLLSGLPGTVLISTHQTEDVAALCDRVIVLDAGLVHFDGTVAQLLTTAAGRVHQGPSATPGAVQTWRTGTGLIRSVGGRPTAETAAVEPTVEDAYLLLRSETTAGVTT
jgi:ABC-2 type transport system ATP-binding protein